jgi:hypothetical protein
MSGRTPGTKKLRSGNNEKLPANYSDNNALFKRALLDSMAKS